MCGRFSVASNHRPAVFGFKYGGRTQRYHRFYGKRHSRFQSLAASAGKVIGHFGVFVHFSAYSVAYHFPYDAVSETFGVTLYGFAYIGNSVALFKSGCPFEKTFFRDFHEFFRFGRNGQARPCRNGKTRFD